MTTPFLVIQKPPQLLGIQWYFLPVLFDHDIGCTRSGSFPSAESIGDVGLVFFDNTLADIPGSKTMGIL